jgi:hypothetical protein
MEPTKPAEGDLQFIRIASPSKDDVAYVKGLMKKGKIKQEDLRENMAFITPSRGPKTEDSE